MKNHKIKIGLPYNIDYLPILLNAIRIMAKIMGFEKNDISKLEIATEEAISNVIRYKYTKDDESTFEVILEVQAMGLMIIIKENNIQYIPESDHHIVSNIEIPKSEYRDFSSIMVKRLMDKVWFHSLGNEEIETHMFRYLKKYKTQTTGLENSHNTCSENTVLPHEKHVNYVVRRMKPHEAIAVSKVAYCTYGNTYLHADIYYPDRVRELNKKKQLLSFIAITDVDEVIAHIAFERSTDKNIPEIGVAFTKPEYRGIGCMNKMMSTSMDEAKKLGFTGVFAQGVTSHPYSQKSLNKFGLRDCALLLSSFRTLTFEDITLEKPHRESVVISFRYMEFPKKMIIYPPDHHSEIIIGLYENIGFSPEIGKSNFDLTPSNSSSEISVSTDIDNQTANIKVVTFGKNILTEVRRIINNICANHISTVFIRLRLVDPLTAKYTSEFEKMGFFFSGIHPRSFANDELILQYLNNHVVDFDQIKMASDKGKEILDYVRKHSENTTGFGK